jgi:aspartyl-tRNA(Asn)/glutamyl-tRNA(Gln) amidotransferase subunit A
MELEGMDPEVKAVVESVLKKMEADGHTLVPISLPHTKYAIPVYYILVPSEDSSNLGRLDGVRYGVRGEGKTLYDLYATSRAAGFPEEVKRRIMIGTYALSAGYYDAYYRTAQRVRTRIIEDFEKAFENVDAILSPTSPFPAFGIGEKSNDVMAMYLADVFVSPAAVAGVPGLSVPIGKSKSGLPIGMQVVGSRLREELVLQVGFALTK